MLLKAQTFNAAGTSSSSSRSRSSTSATCPARPPAPATGGARLAGRARRVPRRRTWRSRVGGSSRHCPASARSTEMTRRMRGDSPARRSNRLFRRAGRSVGVHRADGKRAASRVSGSRAWARSTFHARKSPTTWSRCVGETPAESVQQFANVARISQAASSRPRPPVPPGPPRPQRQESHDRPLIRAAAALLLARVRCRRDGRSRGASARFHRAGRKAGPGGRQHQHHAGPRAARPLPQLPNIEDEDDARVLPALHPAPAAGPAGRARRAARSARASSSAPTATS